MKSVVIPDSVTNIGDTIFINCSKLKTITINSKKPPKIVYSSRERMYGITLKCPKMSKAVKKKFRKELKNHRMECKVK